MGKMDAYNRRHVGAFPERAALRRWSIIGASAAPVYMSGRVSARADPLRRARRQDNCISAVVASALEVTRKSQSWPGLGALSFEDADHIDSPQSANVDCNRSAEPNFRSDRVALPCGGPGTIPNSISQLAKRTRKPKLQNGRRFLSWNRPTARSARARATIPRCHVGIRLCQSRLAGARLRAHDARARCRALPVQAGSLLAVVNETLPKRPTAVSAAVNQPEKVISRRSYRQKVYEPRSWLLNRTFTVCCLGQL
jgi:hypothetical protein